jgi:hypothetical protein
MPFDSGFVRLGAKHSYFVGYTSVGPGAGT